MNVCCVPLVKKLHELVVQSVKIVVLASMVIVVKIAMPVSIAHLRQTILRPVPHVLLEGINLMMGKLAVFLAHQDRIRTKQSKLLAYHVRATRKVVNQIQRYVIHAAKESSQKLAVQNVVRAMEEDSVMVKDPSVPIVILVNFVQEKRRTQLSATIALKDGLQKKEVRNAVSTDFLRPS